MASKKKAKEIEGSGSDASKKQSTTRNHGIQFKDSELWNRFNSLISRIISPCRYLDVNSMDRLGIDEHVIRLLNRLHNLVLRYLYRVMACTIWGRKEGGIMRKDELFMLWAMLYNHPINICYYLIDYFVSIAKMKPDDKCDIVVSGIITFIDRKFE